MLALTEAATRGRRGRDRRADRGRRRGGPGERLIHVRVLMEHPCVTRSALTLPYVVEFRGTRRNDDGTEKAVSVKIRDYGRGNVSRYSCTPEDEE